jgi:thymidylate synthase (FAD)
MKLVKPFFDIIEQSPGLNGIYKIIEIAGRTCYKSSDKITEDSAKNFVERMVKSGHGAILEAGTIYLKDFSGESTQNDNLLKYEKNKYSKSKVVGYERFITTNYRVLIENNWLEDLQYQCEPTEFHEKRISVKFFTQIAITREFNRHRVNSIAESSTRYCNYSKDKFGNELTINLPNNITEELLAKANKCSSIIAIPNDKLGTLYEKKTYEWLDIDWWLWANACCELAYMKLIEKGWKAQDARTILPLDTQSELVHTAFISDWKHFFDLRDNEYAHPSAFELAHPLHDEFVKMKYLNK